MKIKNVIAVVISLFMIAEAVFMDHFPDISKNDVAYASATADGNEFIKDGYLNYKIWVTGSADVTGVSDDCPEVIVIPNKVNGIKITLIDDTFYSKLKGKNVSKIVIPHDDISISQYSLKNVSKDIKVEVASYQSKIIDKLTFKVYPDYAVVSKCDVSAEGEIIIPETVESVPVTDIAVSAFENCVKVKKVVLPQSLTAIERNAFYSCGLEEIELPDSVNFLGSRAFRNCNIKKIIIPDNVKSIGSVFEDCKYLKDVSVSKNISKAYGFSYAFSGCTGLEKCTFIDELTNIADGMFRGCSSLKSIELKDNIEYIGKEAFSGCDSLTDIIIPSSVHTIKTQAFCSCANLKDIYLLGSPQIGFGSINSDMSDTICNRYIFDSANHRYLPAEFDGTIHGYKKSTAQKYAEKYGYKFEAIEDRASTTAASSAAVTTTAAVRTTVTTATVPAKEPEKIGDPNGDGAIDANDATCVLVDYSVLSTGGDPGLTEKQKWASDVNNDGKIDAADATLILQYYAYLSTGGTEPFEKFIKA